MATAILEVAPTTPTEYYPLTVDQFHKMISAGIFGNGERIELLDGLLVKKMTQHTPHVTALGLAEDELRALLQVAWILRTQVPITLATSQPEPDLAVVLGPRRRYEQHHPGPEEIALVVEVADTTLLQDRGLKARIYAGARIPSYWIVNLVDRQVEVMNRPRAGKSPRYLQHDIYTEANSVPLVLSGTPLGAIAVTSLLPARPNVA